MNTRIWYKPDKTISVSYYNPKAEITYKQFMAKTAIDNNLVGCDFDDYDKKPDDEIDIFLNNRKYRAAWVGDKQNGISIDSIKKAKVDNYELPMGGILPIEVEERTEKIAKEIRKLAIKSLQDKGEL